MGPACGSWASHDQSHGLLPAIFFGLKPGCMESRAHGSRPALPLTQNNAEQREAERRTPNAEQQRPSFPSSSSSSFQAAPEPEVGPDILTTTRERPFRGFCFVSQKFHLATARSPEPGRRALPRCGDALVISSYVSRCPAHLPWGLRGHHSRPKNKGQRTAPPRCRLAFESRAIATGGCSTRGADFAYLHMFILLCAQCRRLGA